MNLNEILKLFEEQQQEIKKIILHTNIILYYDSTGNEQTIIINNLSFEEKKIIIHELNKIYNNNGTWKTETVTQEINRKLKELNLMEVWEHKRKYNKLKG